MNIVHHMKKENSGLAVQTIELVEEELRQGHNVRVIQPNTGDPISGQLNGQDVDVHCIHSQINIEAYHDGKPKFLWCHGEPQSSVGNGVSMKAIVDMASMCEAFICMREDELGIWSELKRTYRVTKGIDLDKFKPLAGVTERLSGEPAVLYIENWRGLRNPLYLCMAMVKVWKKYPKARLHLYNCKDQRMLETFKALNAHCKWSPFLRSLQGPVDDVNMLYNRVDMVVSCLYPLYARGIEAFGAGKAFIGPGYHEHGYPYTCDNMTVDGQEMRGPMHPDVIAAAIIKCWEDIQAGKTDFRSWAENHHDIKDTVKQSVAIYEKYL